jgi:hypothetical protein
MRATTLNRGEHSEGVGESLKPSGAAFIFMPLHRPHVRGPSKETDARFVSTLKRRKRRAPLVADRPRRTICALEMGHSRMLLALIPLLLLASPAAHGSTVSITNSVHISHGEKWNPRFWLGNSDEPIPPADYRPNDKHRLQKWYFRNPTHNFNYYVIGIADKNFRRSGRCPEAVFNPRQGWNFAVCKYKFLRLPFVSYQRNRFRFYLGWRERGNFGAEMKFRAAREYQPVQPAQTTTQRSHVDKQTPSGS